MKPKNILVVEDELLVGKDLRNVLISNGFENINLVNTSDGVMELLENSKIPDIIIMDISLNDEKYNRILTAKKIQKNYDIPVVFMTEYIDNETKKNVEKASPYGFLMKPLNHDAISIALETAFTRHQQELKIKKDEEKYRVITDQSFLSIFIIQNKKIIYANESFQEFIGYSMEEIYKFRKTEILQLFSEKENDSHFLISDLLSVSKPKQITLSCPLICKNSELKWVEIYSKIIKYNSRNSRLITLVDITERKKRESINEQVNIELNKKNDELDKLINITSQDLRSPLLNIHGFGSELQYSIDKMKKILEQNKNLKNIHNIVDEDIPEALDFIMSSTRKMEKLIGGILKIVRIKKETIFKNSLNIRTIIERILKDKEENILEKNIKIQLISPIHKVMGDKKLLPIVFEKVIDNSIQYSDKNKNAKIKISSLQKRNSIIYCIEDNGIGISSHFFDKIFDFYTRYDPYCYDGDGIGLTVVKEIMNVHNGKCWLESKIGKGTKFFIQLDK